MKLVTFNCNFNMGGLEMLQELIDGDHDMICVQRFDMKYITRLNLNGMNIHFFTSFPNPPMHRSYGYRYGLLTIWSPRISGDIKEITFKDEITGDDRAQGNTMVRFDTKSFTVINSLVGYPYDSKSTAEVDSWLAQVNECMAEAAGGKTILVGDFHYQDDDPIWDNVNKGGLRNVVSPLSTFRTDKDQLISIDKIFVPASIDVIKVDHAVIKSGWRCLSLPMLHWPVTAELVI